MKKPMLIPAHNLVKMGWPETCGRDGVWTPLRPDACPSERGFFTRLRLAWRVFTGQYDALRWHDQ